MEKIGGYPRTALSLAKEKSLAAARLDPIHTSRLRLALAAGDLLFRDANVLIGLFVLLCIVAGFVPELMRMSQIGLGRRHVNLIRMQRNFGEDRHALRKHLDKAPRDEEGLLARRTAVKTNFARAEFGEQRRSAVKRLKIAGRGRQLN